MARQIAKDHDNKRAQIMSTAASVFARDGFDRASMNQIAEACGISKANIYHYYRSKNDLLFDLLDAYLSELLERVLASDVPQAAPEIRFRTVCVEILRAYQGADDHHRLQISALGALPDDQQKALRHYQRTLVRHLDQILGALAPTRFSEQTELRKATMSVFGMLNWYFMWNAGAGSKARDDYAAFVADLTLNGVHTAPA